ncbi:Lovastatin diketide synthase LovF [Cyphellophora attinorum]|uniref:Lovastatin diketide synthase LovF n=1 Tax=Cyphellophora attinorum TaxID=1664694 RepID=A0A0N0NI03_9EURO|nr:Lovastatin diketide synthase LovF [Phialophora attinorum]KPI35158.1 Lovastatin diketide synthase LovF [Phialophora attinorum]
MPSAKDTSAGDSRPQPSFYEPLAIVGLACRLPGNINSPSQFWELLKQGKDARGPIPESRYASASFDDHRRRTTGPATTPEGYFLGHDLEHFDAECFSMNRTEAAHLDPVQRQLLEITQECLDSADVSDSSGRKIGCFVGTFGEDWQDLRRKDTLDHGPYRMIGSSDFAASNRISFEYDFRGPSVTYRTACSASMVALHSACQALQMQDCDAALVAAANLIFSPTNTSGLADLGALAPDGSSKTFDASASGYARAEAVSALYVKRLDDAMRDGDHIRAVIRATASNSDGRSSAFANPNPDAHVELMRSAYAASGLAPQDTAFVEMHGTGTAVGDPLEAEAVARVFGGSQTYIGSVKPNVGHAEGASGLTSIFKAVLALEHGVIPPNIKFNLPNPKIRFGEAGLIVPVAPTPWPAHKARRVSVNSFGLGGSNAHAIIESWSSNSNGALNTAEPSTGSHLIAFSAFRDESLKQMIDQTREYVSKNADSDVNVAYTMNTRRQHRRKRGFTICRDGQLIHTHMAPETLTNPRVVFVFTGQGALSLGAGAQLAERYPSFDADLVSMDRTLQATSEPPSWCLRKMVRDRSGHVAKITGVISQPLCIAVQIALVNLLESWGTRPDAVVGHSSGEIVAAYASGALNMKEAILMAFWRGQSLPVRQSDGSMAAVEMSEEDVQPYLSERVCVACVNSPSNVTLSGDKTALAKLVAKLKQEKPTLFARTLPVDHAYHSHHMEAAAEVYAKKLGSEIRPKKRSVPFYSTVHGRLLRPEEHLDATYWTKNVVQAVLFAPAVAPILKDQTRPTVFIEIGPHRTLFSLGMPVDLETLTPHGRHLHDLPSYPWHRERLWNESRISRQWRMRPFPRHELLGVPILENNELEPTWRNVLRVNEVPWIADHQIDANIVFPGAGYIAMVGECMRQLAGGNSDAYTVKDVSIKNALVVHENQSAELITSLKPFSWSKNQPSSGWEFCISSYQNSRWTLHCTGTVREGFVEKRGSVHSQRYTRVVDEQRLYRTMAKSGLKYGPCFATLRNISADVHGKRAAASIATAISSSDPGSAQPYAVHPTSIDAMFQALMVADVKGHPRDLSGICVPVAIAEMSVRRNGGKSSTLHLNADVEAQRSEWQGLHGSFDAFNGASDGAPVVAVQARGVQLAQVGEPAASSRFESNYSSAELAYRPCLSLMKAEQRASLLRPEADIAALQDELEQLTLDIIRQRATLLRNIKGKTPSLERYRQWILSVADFDNQDDEAGWVTVQDSLDTSAVSPPACQRDHSHSAATLISRVGKNLIDIIEGRSSLLEHVLDETLLAMYYQWGERFDYSRFIQLFAHENPGCRILEIGAGTGGTAAKVLSHLYAASPSNHPLCSEYAYTDVSEGFLTTAKERFAEHAFMTYRTFDISQDPASQGIKLADFDLVIAANVVHATAFLQGSLANIRKVMKPGATLLLQELCSQKNSTSFIMGGFAGWWLGAEVGDAERMTKPYVSPERWDQELRAAGFGNGAESVVFDSKSEEAQLCAMISSRFLGHQQAESRLLASLVVAPDHNDELIQNVSEALQQSGFSVAVSALGSVPTGDYVVSLLDMAPQRSVDSAPWAVSESKSAEVDSFRQRKALIVGLRERQRMVWITPGSRSTKWDPRHSMVLGLARTLRLERDMDFSILEVNDDEVAELSKCLPGFLQGQRRRQDRGDKFLDETSRDYEYRLENGHIHVGRYQWHSIEEALASAASLPSNDEENVNRLAIRQPGVLQSLEWQNQKLLSHIGPDEVKVKVAAVGVNFRDVLTAMGVISSPSLGIEAAGIVTATGANVVDLSIGDHVAVLTEGAFATSLIVSRLRCAKLPEYIAFEQAASIYSVFCTNMLALHYVAKIDRGMTIMIHSACGGIGLSAIRLCQNAGVEIFATVGSAEKAEYLQTRFDIPADHIFGSRSTSFKDDLLRATNGRGVDVVLNSLSGELLDASWDCLAEFGLMLELGKRDMQDGGALRMANFSQNRGYRGVDLAHVVAERPELCASLMKDVTKILNMGLIEPLAPIKTYEAAEIEQCFRYFQKGEHMGKVVVTMPTNVNEASIVQPTRSPGVSFSADAGYLLVGGLGGLGQAVAVWMAEHGARHFVFISRTGRSTATDAFFEELSAMGCAFDIVKGSVVDPEVVSNVVRMSRKPISGILQMAMELQDVTFANMSEQEWLAATEPKVTGTMNLHKACLTLPTPLDFFVMFASQNGLHGWHGQSNYAAANTFLDAFAQYRRNQGLAASVIDIGPVEDIGFVSGRKDVQSKMAPLFRFTPEHEFLAALELAIIQSTPTSTSAQVIPGFHPRSVGGAGRAPWSGDARFSAYQNLEDIERRRQETRSPGQAHSTSRSSSTRMAALSKLLAAPLIGTMSRQEAFDVVAQAILERLCITTGMDLEPLLSRDSTSIGLVKIQDVGMDSLIAIDFQSWWRQVFRAKISVLEIMDLGTIGRLTERALDLVEAAEGGSQAL